MTVVGTLVTIPRAGFRREILTQPGVLLVVALAAASVISYIAHPINPGLIVTIAAVVVTGMALAIANLDSGDVRRLVAVPLLAMATFQAFLIAVQSATGTAFGLTVLQPGQDLLIVDGLLRPQGTYYHVYEPTATALVAIAIGLALLPKTGRPRLLFLIAIGAATTTVALTHSRGALIGVFLIGLVTIVQSLRDRHLRLGVLVVATAFLVPALMTFGSWQTRFDQSTATADDTNPGRPGQVREAVLLISEHPVVGAGPQNYIEQLDVLEPNVEHFYAVHNTPLMVTAELGIPAGLIFTVLLVALGWKAMTADYRPRLVFVAAVPFLLLDILFYDRPFGLLLLSVWAGTTTALTISAHAEHEPRPVAHGPGDG